MQVNMSNFLVTISKMANFSMSVYEKSLVTILEVGIFQIMKISRDYYLIRTGSAHGMGNAIWCFKYMYEKNLFLILKN